MTHLFLRVDEFPRHCSHLNEVNFHNLEKHIQHDWGFVLGFAGLLGGDCGIGGGVKDKD